MSDELRTLSDVQDELGLKRQKCKVEELVGEPIIVESFRPWIGRFGPCFTVNICRAGMPCFFVTGGTVIKQKLAEVEAHFPLECTIIREEEYYDIV